MAQQHGVPGLPGAPHPVFANVQPPAPQNYREKYLADPDVTNGQYAALLSAQEPESAVQPATMLQSMLTASDDVPKAFLVMLPGERAGDPVRIKTVHAVSVYRPSAVDPTPWDSQPYAFDTDLFPGSGAHISTVEFPTNAFHRTNNVQVPTAAAMDTKWIDADAAAAAGAAPVPTLGPYENVEADTRILRVRYAIRVPHKYLPLVLGVTYKPRQLYDELVVNVRANGDEAMLTHLIDWVCAACTLTFDANNDPASPVTLLPNGLVRPGIDERLAAHVRDKVYADVPAVKPNPTNDNAMTQYFAFSAQERQHEAALRQAQRIEDKAPKLLSSTNPELTLAYMRACEVDNEADLPPLLQKVHNAKKDQRRTTIETAFGTRCLQPDAATTQVPAVTNEFVTMLMKGAYGTNNLDDLTQGLTPYQFNHHAHDKATHVEAQGSAMDRILSGDASPTLGELQQLRITTVDQPTQLDQVESGLQALSIVQDCSHGTHHRLSVYLRDDICRVAWPRAKHILQTIIRADYSHKGTIQPVPWLANIFRSIQIRLCEFHNSMALPHSTPVPLPDLTGIFAHCIHRQYLLLTPLPTAYLHPLPTPAATPPARPPPASARVPAGAPPAAARQPPPDDQRHLVMNAAVNAAHKLQFESCGKTITALREDARAPLKNHGGRICLSWHLKGSCFTNCGTCNGNTLDGHSPLVGDEINRFATFVAVAVTRA